MFEVSWLAPQSCVEPGSDALMEQLGALSVSVEDADAGSNAEQALFGEPGTLAATGGEPQAWNRCTLKALFEAEEDATRAAAWLSAQAWAGGLELVNIVPLADQDWVQLTQAQFTPTQISPGFWIVPTWHEPPADAKTVIRLDPGQAFGTGTHPTTRMCLRWIARQGNPDAESRVLDYGCGSGILAIAAALHGAGVVEAVDIDPVAVGATLTNAKANHARVRAGTPDMASGEYQLVLANILATPLKLLAPLLCAHLAPGASIVLAGILERQAGELSAAYTPWLNLQVTDNEDGWILMTGKRPLPTRVA